MYAEREQEKSRPSAVTLERQPPEVTAPAAIEIISQEPCLDKWHGLFVEGKEMAAVSREEIEQLLAQEGLPTRPHPRVAGKVQFRYVDNRGRTRWHPKKGCEAECFLCGTELHFVQVGDGTVYAVCERCRQRWSMWWPARGYEVRRDGNAAWRRAVNGGQRT